MMIFSAFVSLTSFSLSVLKAAFLELAICYYVSLFCSSFQQSSHTFGALTIACSILSPCQSYLLWAYSSLFSLLVRATCSTRGGTTFSEIFFSYANISSLSFSVSANFSFKLLICSFEFTISFSYRFSSFACFSMILPASRLQSSSVTFVSHLMICDSWVSYLTFRPSSAFSNKSFGTLRCSRFSSSQ